MRHQVRHHNIRFIFILLTLFVFMISTTACVSVKLGGEEVSKSKQVKYNAPSSPFKPISLKNADSAWQNSNSGTTLSYISVCNDSSDPKLESMRDSTLRGLENMNIIEEKVLPFNGREGLRSKATGQLDGVKVEVNLMLFKKNFCNYTISMVGLVGKGEKDVGYFEEFIKDFVAP